MIFKEFQHVFSTRAVKVCSFVQNTQERLITRKGIFHTLQSNYFHTLSKINQKILSKKRDCLNFHVFLARSLFVKPKRGEKEFRTLKKRSELKGCDEKFKSLELKYQNLAKIPRIERQNQSRNEKPKD